MLCLVAGLSFVGCGKEQSNTVGQGGTGDVTNDTGGSASAPDAMAEGGVANDASSVDASTGVVATLIAAAVTHACAVVNGAVYCWGENQFGQLGNGTTTASSLPVQVQGLTSGVEAVAAGWRISCAIVRGIVYCWGDAWFGDAGVVAGSFVPLQVQGLGSHVETIAADVNICWALVDGAAYDWGDNFNASAAAPVQVEGLDAGVEDLANGPCAVINGAAFCWGLNRYGQLGNGFRTDSSVPVQVQGLTSGVSAMASSGDHACAVMNGIAYCWGNNNSGQLGHDPRDPADTTCYHSDSITNQFCSLVPSKVQGLPGVVEKITAGTLHTCAIASGAAYCWGANGFGQLGDGTTTTTYQPVQVQGLTGVTAISAGAYPDPNGYDITCAVANGDIYCWGSNAYGQLGDGTTTDSAVPVKVQFP